MKSHGFFLVLAASLFGCEAFLLNSNASTSAIMLVSGMSSPEELCLTESAGRIGLEACSSAIAAGDGRELWSLLGGGQLMNIASKKCASSLAGRTALSTSDCADASTWKLLANGQIQMGEKCLSQNGEGAGIENTAVHAAVTATSSANSASHAASAAVDADDATFWASRPGDVGPIALTVDLGEARSISLVKIVWEFPAQSFAVSVSLDGSDWTEIFATSVNMVQVSRIPLGLTASKLRIDMTKPHPFAGSASGKPVYGVRSIAALAHRLDATLDDCATASHSKDARDKYFPIAVSDFDPASSAALHAQQPSVVAAKASLSAALGEIGALPSCDNQGPLLGSRGLLVSPSSNDAEDELLLATARSMIISARDTLGR